MLQRPKQIILTLLFCAFGLQSLMAQLPVPTFQEITPEDILAFKDVDYPDFPAVILSDYGEVSLDFTTTTRIRYIEHRRLKILNEDGIRYTLFQKSFPGSEKRQPPPRVTAATYSLNARGEVLKADVAQRRIQTEKLSNFGWEVKFVFPLAKVGDILEYTIEWYNGELDELEPWQFQRELPVEHSEYHSFFPNFANYVQIFRAQPTDISISRGFYSQEINQSQFRNRSRRSFSDGFRAGFDRNAPFGFRDLYIATGIHTIYQRDSIAPFLAESLMPSKSDVVPSVSFKRAQKNTAYASANRTAQLFGKAVLPGRLSEAGSLGLPRYPYDVNGYEHLTPANLAKKRFLKDWESLNRQLTRRGSYLRSIDGVIELPNRGKRLSAKSKLPVRQAKSIFEYVQKRMVWDGNYSLDARSLKEAYLGSQGNSTQINMILLGMLKGAGLQAFPVMVRTKERGYFDGFFPDVDQFNHTVVAVQFPNKITLLDATDKYTDFGTLPLNHKNQLGFLVDKESWGWLEIEPSSTIFRRTCGSFNLDSLGSLKGSIQVLHNTHSAAIERKKINEEEIDSTEYVKLRVLGGLKDEISLMDFVIGESEMTDESLSVVANIETNQFVQKVDQFIFLKPMLTRMVAENPFPPVERAFPISFSAPLRDFYLLGIKIPDGYEVVQTPERIFVRLGDDGGSFAYSSYLDGDYLFISSSIQLFQTFFGPEVYGDLIQFFAYVVEKHAQDIVLKREQI